MFLYRETLTELLSEHEADGEAFRFQPESIKTAVDDPRGTEPSCAQRLEHERGLIGQTSFDYSYFFTPRYLNCFLFFLSFIYNHPEENRLSN